MQSLVLVLLVLGLIMMALGYQKKLLKNMETKTVVEYRFIPRSIYEDQFGFESSDQLSKNLKKIKLIELINLIKLNFKKFFSLAIF